MIDILKPDFINYSEKGRLVQLVHDKWKQVNVVVYNKGTVSGNHFHKYNEEVFYIVKGHIELRVRKFDCGSEEKYEFKTGDMFCIHKNTVHTLVYYEDSILVALYDNGVELDSNEKDIWTI